MQGGPDAANLKARLRSLRYRQRTMQPRKDKLREVLDHVEEYRTSSKPMTEDEYEVRAPLSATPRSHVLHGECCAAMCDQGARAWAWCSPRLACLDRRGRGSL